MSRRLNLGSKNEGAGANLALDKPVRLQFLQSLCDCGTGNAELANQLFLVFVLGGMMLGGSALLAPRPEAFVIFLTVTGMAPVGPPAFFPPHPPNKTAATIATPMALAHLADISENRTPMLLP